MSILPWFFSEIGATGTVNKACRPSAGATCTMIATDNEANINRYGRPIGKRGRLATVKRGWRAHIADEAAGIASSTQGDVHQMHKAMFPGLPLPSLRVSSRPDDVWNAIGPYAVSLAIYAGAVPASDAVRRYVNGVNHQGAAIDKRVKDGVRQVKWADPMHPPSDTYTGHWVLWSSLSKCARQADESGAFIYELYPAGAWTQEKLATQQAQLTIRSLRSSVATLRERNEKLDARVDALSDQLTECQATQKDCKPAIDAALTALLDDLTAELASRRP